MKLDPKKIQSAYDKIIAEINKPYLEIKKVAEKILDVLVELFEATRGEITIIREDFDPATMPFTEENVVKLRVKKGYTEEEWEKLVNSGVILKSLFNAIFNKKNILYKDTKEEPPFEASLSEELGHGCWMNHPLVLQNRTLANIHLAKKERFQYEEEELEQLKQISQLLATAINIANLWEKERTLVIDFIKSLNKALEIRDTYTAGHSERVSFYAGLIAESMGLEEKEVEVIKLAAILHDIGKIGVPDEILKKKGTLTYDEKKVIEQHVVLTDDILRSLTFLNDARLLAVYHHESIDGQGYIHGIKGEEIPLGSRIIAIADAFDAMTSVRPYREPIPVEIVIQKMSNSEIHQWDKDILKHFFNLLHTSKYKKLLEAKGLVIYNNKGKYDREKSLLKFLEFDKFWEEGG